MRTDISERQIDVGSAGDLIFLVTPSVCQKVNSVVFAANIGTHWAGPQLAAIARNEHREANLVHEVPHALNVARVVIGHFLLLSESQQVPGSPVPKDDRATMLKPAAS